MAVQRPATRRRRGRSRERLILIGFGCVYMAAFGALSLSRRVGPGWSALALAAIGWIVFGLFAILNVLALWGVKARHLPRRPGESRGP
ncbi:hypothetical protein OJF2_73720 [Aquisphaera giovannonii]|uniref:Uncharacterized protein n=1 Tax=Aquisphaera giovannonii TaxID=406548 RepID=A0A5B9WDR0_9BACT|nr:hypothetical protein OJF2_73720 [Aquisphaera giovannonii]